MSAVDKVD